MMIIDIDHHDPGRSFTPLLPCVFTTMRFPGDQTYHTIVAPAFTALDTLSTPSESPASGPLPVIPEENEFAQNSARETQCTRRTTLYKRYVY